MNSITPEQQQQIRQIALSGQVIDAIKEYRALTNASLKDAKDAVEALVRGDYVNSPATPVSSQAAVPSQVSQILELMARNQEIEAIKLYRALTNAGLKEAKDAVEAMTRGEQVNLPVSQIPSPAADASADVRIREMLARNQKIEAIKIYRLATRVDLKEAKDYVEAIEAQMRAEDPSHFSAPPTAIGNDPFAEEDSRTRRMLIIAFLVVVVLAGLAYLFLRKGF